MCGKIIHFVFLGILVLFCAINLIAKDLCDPTNGAPSNGEYCMLIPSYDTFQRAECGRPPFTTSSNKTETCADGCRDYCWFPCMVKEFDQRNGTVDPACACQGDTDQMCEHPTGSVLYFTECLNKSAPPQCSPPTYIDFVAFYFNWISAEIASGISCENTANLTSFRVCLDTRLRSLAGGIFTLGLRFDA